MPTPATLAQPHALALDQVRACERHSARAWPAPDVHRRDGWELRLTPGSRSRRVNSLNAMEPAPGRFAEVLADARARCRERDLPCTVRLTPLTPPEALAELAAAAQTDPKGETLVMRVALPLALSPPPAVEVAERVTPLWLEGVAASGADADERALIARLVGAVDMPQGFAVLLQDDAPAAVGRVAVENGMAGVFHIATAPAARRRGYGKAVMAALLGWASARGAQTAYLQVVADNHPAVGLYGRLGFREAYRYAYLQV